MECFNLCCSIRNNLEFHAVMHGPSWKLLLFFLCNWGSRPSHYWLIISPYSKWINSSNHATLYTLYTSWKDHVSDSFYYYYFFTIYLVPNASDIPVVHRGMPQLAPGSKANHTYLINLQGREDESFWVLWVGRAVRAWCPNEMGVNWPGPGSITYSYEGACADR